MSSTDALIVSGSEAALTAGEYDRARMLLGLALRIDTRREARRVDAALGRCSAPPPCEPLLARLLQQWEALAPPEQREPSVRGWRERHFAFAGEEPPEQPYPQWAAPTVAQLEQHLASSLFSGAAKSERATLLAREARGATTCDLLAALVQLLMGAPFAPAS